jgi:hypothetical protein
VAIETKRIQHTPWKLHLHPVRLNLMSLHELDEDTHIQLANFDDFGQDKALGNRLFRIAQGVLARREHSEVEAKNAHLLEVIEDGRHGWDRLANPAAWAQIAKRTRRTKGGVAS